MEIKDKEANSWQRTFISNDNDNYWLVEVPYQLEVLLVCNGLCFSYGIISQLLTSKNKKYFSQYFLQ